MTRTLLSSGVLTLLLALSSSTPARAIPICPSGTMADYIGFGATGCQFNSLTFSNFSYQGFVVTEGLPPEPILVPVVPQPSPSAVPVQPRSDPASLGSGGAGLTFSVPPPGLFWGNVGLTFDVAGPGILQDVLSHQAFTFANLVSPFVSEFANPPGEFTSVAFPLRCQFPNLNDPHFDPAECPSLRPISLAAATPFQEIRINGQDERSIQANFATPEPTTLLLFGTSAAGLGLARWLKRRRL